MEFLSYFFRTFWAKEVNVYVGLHIPWPVCLQILRLLARDESYVHYISLVCRRAAQDRVIFECDRQKKVVATFARLKERVADWLPYCLTVDVVVCRSGASCKRHGFLTHEKNRVAAFNPLLPRQREDELVLSDPRSMSQRISTCIFYTRGGQLYLVSDAFAWTVCKVRVKVKQYKYFVITAYVHGEKQTNKK